MYVSRTEDNFNDALLKLFFLVAGQQTFRNSPNDVTVRSDGTIWFTDPDYGVVAKMGHGNAIEQLRSCDSMVVNFSCPVL